MLTFEITDNDFHDIKCLLKHPASAGFSFENGLAKTNEIMFGWK